MLSVNSAKAAVDAFAAGLAGLLPDALWADLNTASPGTKRQLADIAAAARVPLADVAMMAPVPGKKLLRSVFYKGMAAAVVEALEAARAAGDEPWLRAHIAAELAAADTGTTERIIEGTRRHAVRRTAEMEAAAGMLTELGVPPLMAGASRALHERLARNSAASQPNPLRQVP